MNRIRSFAWVALISLLCAGLSPSVAAPARKDGPQAIRSDLKTEAAPGEETPTALPRVATATYDVHVYGGSAVGRLSQEYFNESGVDLEALFAARLPPGLEWTRLDVEADGALVTVETKTVEVHTPAPPKAHTRNGRSVRAVKKADAKPKPSLFATEPFELVAGGRLDLHTSFRMQLGVDGHTMRLELPALEETATREQPIPVKVMVTVHHPSPLFGVRSESHGLLSDFEGDRTIIEPVESYIQGNRPFVIDFALSSNDRANVISRVGAAKNGLRPVETVLNPPKNFEDTSVRAKQVLFVIDSSGSMSRQEKLVQARRAVLSCVEQLRPVDRFNIVDFDSRFSWMAPLPVDPTVFGVDETSRWLESLRADGGTHLLPALESAIEMQEDPDRHRIVIVVTDGILQDEKEALKLLDEKLGDARLFTVGTGPQLRQETLLRLAERGRGAAAFAGSASELESAVAELFASVSNPLGWDVTFDWGSAQVEEISPTHLPDLYSGRPVRVLAWVRGELPDSMGVRMTTSDGEERYNVALPPSVAP
ncbi:MAG: VWA domain-containing protein [bacterium]|nr:VWA domain-containing protein [bacterium]